MTIQHKKTLYRSLSQHRHLHELNLIPSLFSNYFNDPVTVVLVTVIEVCVLVTVVEEVKLVVVLLVVVIVEDALVVVLVILVLVSLMVKGGGGFKVTV